MKKTLVLASLLAIFGAASAQSSVTLGGALDVAAQDTNTTDLAMTETHGSRFFIKGSETLGSGLKAVFNIEHRLNLTTGAGNANFWNGQSYIGLEGGFGALTFGRQYTASFLGANNQADPFGGDGAGALRGVGMRTQNTNGTLRVASGIKYTGNFGPVAVAVSTDLDGVSTNKAHTGFALGYAAGPLTAGFGQDNGTAGNKVANLYATYNFGVAKLHLGSGKDTTAAGVATTGMLVAVSAPVGAGTVKAGLATAKSAGVTSASKFGLGYSQNLSARTSFDVTYGKDSKGAKASGYDLTLTHKF